MSTKIKISTEYTFFLKVVLPAIFSLGIIGGFIALIKSEQYNAIGALVFITGAGGSLMYFTFVRLKSVSIDNDYFYISNYFKTIKVSISDLKDVTDRNLPGSYKPITLHFRSENYFGQSAIFLPEFASPNSNSKLPLAEKLRRLI